MFKLGGKTNDAQGTGITSGLDTQRNNYVGGGTIGGGMIHGNPMGNRTGFKEPTLSEQLSAIDVGVSPETRKRAFWSGIGQGFGSNPRTLGEALSGAVAARDQILGPAEAAAGERKFKLDVAGVEMPYERETAELITELEGKVDIKVAQIQAESTATAQRIKLLREKFKKDDGTIDTFNPEYIAQRDTIIDDFSRTQSANKLMIAILNAGMATNETDALKMAIKMILGAEAALLPGNAYGGRPRSRYQFGATNQGVQPTQVGSNQPTQVGLNVDETIQTPAGTVQEDVSVRENIQPSVNMTYQEFRAKMPPQVDDEIVQLIYYNQDAFADFAQIKTQDEVYAFNNKWGVSLVLPIDTETT